MFLYWSRILLGLCLCPFSRRARAYVRANLLLRRLEACRPARDWVSRYVDPARAYEECEDPGWLLWLLHGRLRLDCRRSATIACRAIRLAVAAAPGRFDEPRFVLVLTAAEAFAAGDGTPGAVQAACREFMEFSAPEVGYSIRDLVYDLRGVVLHEEAAADVLVDVVREILTVDAFASTRFCVDIIREVVPYSAVVELARGR